MSTTDYTNIQFIANNDVKVLREKGATYGDSWKQRGGVGAFMMLARKWDRIENQAKSNMYDIFTAIHNSTSTDGLLDDIRDLRCYLLLVEEEITGETTFTLHDGEPTAGYVNQDR